MAKAKLIMAVWLIIMIMISVSSARKAADALNDDLQSFFAAAQRRDSLFHNHLDDDEYLLYRLRSILNSKQQNRGLFADDE